MMTLEDIARISNLSKVTVSRALNNRPGVKEATRRKVLETIEDQGYYYDPQTCRLKRLSESTSSRSIRRLTFLAGPKPERAEPDPDDHKWGRFMAMMVTEGILRAAHDQAFEVVLQPSLHHSSATVEEIEGRVAGRNFDGVIAIGQQSRTFYDTLHHLGIPLAVVFGVNVPDSAGIVVDPDFVSGIIKVVDYLLAMGHRRIACFRGTKDFGGISNSAEDRRTIAFAGAMIHGGGDLRPEYYQGLEGRYHDSNSGYELMGHLMSLDVPPTAVFAGNDVMAAGALRYCRAKGLDVPDDVSIVGFDDLYADEWSSQFLTTVSWNPQDLGRVVASGLISAIEQSDLMPRRILLPTKLVERQSVRRLASG